jgi:hypothetical protein
MADTTEYIDRATAMNLEARDELKKTLTKENAFFVSDVEMVKARTISAVNRAIKMGDAMQEYTGHTKLLPAEYGQFALAINDAPIAFAKECVSIRQGNDEPVTTYAQAAPIFERLLVQYELLPKEGHGEQTKHPHEPIMDFIKSVSIADAESVELLEEHPMETWERFNVVGFFNNSKRTHDLHELAGRILKEKVD